MAFVPDWMLVTINAAALLDQPLAKCRALHDPSPLSRRTSTWNETWL
jgi:hypothetical protein